MVIRGSTTGPSPLDTTDEVKEFFVEVPTPEEMEQARKSREEHEKNAAVFDSMMHEIYDNYRGQFVVIAGGEFFVGPDNREVNARAKAAHPETDGSYYHRYIRRKHEAGYY